MSFSPFPASPRRQPKPSPPFRKESGYSSQDRQLVTTSSSARASTWESAHAGQSLPAGPCVRPAPALAPAHCGSCLGRPASVGVWAGGQVAQLPRFGGEPGRGRAVTPPETFSRSRQDAALGPFQSALTAFGVFQGWSLESCGCVVQDSQTGSRPQMALPSVLRAVPGTRLRFPHLTRGKYGWPIKTEF